MSPELNRREGDPVLNDIATRLALVEQSQTHAARLTESNQKVLEQQIAALAADVRAAIVTQQAANAEAIATPAGRALTERLNRHHKLIEDGSDRLDKVEEFVEGFNGTVRGLKAIVAILTVVAAIQAILAALP